MWARRGVGVARHLQKSHPSKPAGPRPPHRQACTHRQRGVVVGCGRRAHVQRGGGGAERGVSCRALVGLRPQAVVRHAASRLRAVAGEASAQEGGECDWAVGRRRACRVLAAAGAILTAAAASAALSSGCACRVSGSVQQGRRQAEREQHVPPAPPPLAGAAGRLDSSPRHTCATRCSCAILASMVHGARGNGCEPETGGVGCDQDCA